MKTTVPAVQPHTRTMAERRESGSWNASDRRPHPLVVTEAAAVGLPVVVSDAVGCVGASDTARAGVNSIVFPVGDTTALHTALCSLVEDREYSNRLARGSRSIGEEQTAEVPTTRLVDALDNLRRLGPRVPRRQPL
ncbi:MAG TPA: glycosyltransferase [Thermoanaerobaculia bacterium]|nr:glycosyltransferase [Thermoanaerobaculia bacterium]